MGMRYVSLFSGIEAASVAWEPLGWECVALSEIDTHASMVLAHRYPGIPNLGDVTKITDDQIRSLGQIDLVVGGSPCQDMSIAGKRPTSKHFAKYPDLYQQNPDGSWTVFMDDGHRYKMTGNSMAVPVMRDIGVRISRSVFRDLDLVPSPTLCAIE